MITRRTLLKGAVGSLACVAATATYAFFVEPVLRLTVREWTITPEVWPKSVPPLRIAALADFHVAKPWMTAERVASIVTATMRLRPDLIVLLGDYMPGMSRNWAWGFPTIAEWTQALGRLRAPLGVFAVPGNHDTDLEGIRAGFAAINVPLLENAAVRIACNGFDFWLAGLGDCEAKRDDLKTALARVNDDSPLILLAHEPESFPEIAAMQRHVMLTLSGHNHGGQVWLPFAGAVFMQDKPYVYGHFTENGRHLIVSGGLGTTRVPIRFLVPPEITMINVRPAGTSSR